MGNLQSMVSKKEFYVKKLTGKKKSDEIVKQDILSVTIAANQKINLLIY